MRGPGCGNKEGRGPRGAGAVAAAWPSCAPPGGRGRYQWAAKDTAQSSSTTLHCSSLDLGLMNQFAQRHWINLNMHVCLKRQHSRMGGRTWRPCQAPKPPQHPPPAHCPLAGPPGAVWLCPEDNWTQFPHWHFRGPGHHAVGQDWFTKEVSLFLENYNHSGPPGRPHAPATLLLGVLRTSLWPVGTAPWYWAWMQTKPSE